MTKLIVFDLEGILVQEEFLVELAKVIGKEKEVHKITEDGLNGKIEWVDGLKKRIEMLKGLDYDAVKRTASKFTFYNGVENLIQKLKKNGFKIAAISGGFRIFSEPIVEKLGIDYSIANEFIFENKKLKGCKINVNKNKDQWLKKFARECEADFVIAVGDGENDMDMLRAADCGILIKGRNLHVLKTIFNNDPKEAK